MSKKAVMLGQQIVDDFSKRNLDVALQVLSIAALHGYRDISWAVNKYKEQYKFVREIRPAIVSEQPKVVLSSEVF